MAGQSPPPADDSEASILNLVKQVQYKAYVQLEAVFQPLGITAVQFRILTTISSRPGLCSADLARIYDVKPQSMIRQIGLLEDAGLIARTSNAKNKRLLELELTKAGQKCLGTCQKAAMALEQDLLLALSSPQREELRKTLQVLLASLNAPANGVSSNEEFSEEYRRAGVQRV